MDVVLLKKLRNKINEEIRFNLNRCDTPVSLQMMKYQLGLLESDFEKEQGKRFRPTLCLLSSLAISGDYKKTLPAAAAIELIHNFSLIHDDIQDEDEYRRGRFTVWKKWSKNQAINAGDAMHTLANLALQRLFKMDLPLEVINSVFYVINNACYQMCEGQMLDIAYENKLKISLAQYLQIIQKKTAALIESAAFAGALIATRNKKVIKCYKNFGLNVGMAFQIFNDLSGFEKKARFTHLHSDLAKNKKILPLVLTLKNLKFKKDMGTKEMLEKTNAIQNSRRIGEDYLRKAILELEKTGIKNSVQELLKEYTISIKTI